MVNSLSVLMIGHGRKDLAKYCKIRLYRGGTIGNRSQYSRTLKIAPGCSHLTMIGS